MANTTRFRRDPMTALAFVALACGFISGTMAGAAGTIAYVQPPPQTAQCASAPDPIACLIVTAESEDDEEEEPPR